ncbi:MAG TPA: hypothetical protein VIM00_12585 [Candidatus Acidoferrum sp.]
MATAAASGSVKTRAVLPGRKYDHWFFNSMAVLLFCTVAFGFARTYYLAGVFHAPLPSPIIHVHGAVFSAWIIFLVAQTALVGAGRVDLHRKLGTAGFLLACLMVFVGMWAAANAIGRGSHPPGVDAATFLIVPATDILIFGTLIFFAWRARFNAAAHKRLVMVATVALMTAAVARWPFAMVQGKIIAAAGATYVFLVFIVIYDLWSTHKVHRATLWSSLFLIAVEFVRFPVSQTAVWRSFAGWVAHFHA